MFIELLLLLAARTVLITVAKVDDHTLRVNVIPHAKAGENSALATPLTYTGPPEELDAETGEQLAGYVETHQPTASALAAAKAALEAAAKAAQQEAKRKAEERKKAAHKPPDKGLPPATAQPPSVVSPAAESAASPKPMEALGLFPGSAL